MLADYKIVSIDHSPEHMGDGVDQTVSMSQYSGRTGIVN